MVNQGNISDSSDGRKAWVNRLHTRVDGDYNDTIQLQKLLPVTSTGGI